MNERGRLYLSIMRIGLFSFETQFPPPRPFLINSIAIIHSPASSSMASQVFNFGRFIAVIVFARRWVCLFVYFVLAPRYLLDGFRPRVALLPVFSRRRLVSHLSVFCPPSIKLICIYVSDTFFMHPKTTTWVLIEVLAIDKYFKTGDNWDHRRRKI
jgi:hypothetical protein